MNVKATHSTKGHQNHEGSIFFTDDPRFRFVFQSSFDSEKDKKEANGVFLKYVHRYLRQHIQNYKLSTNLRDDSTPTDLKSVAAMTHIGTISQYRKKGSLVDGLASHKTCFCCLASSPAYQLACGHIICRLCLEDFSHENPENYVRTVDNCPLCGIHSGQQFAVKPPTAGLRVLCLDG